MKYSRDPRPVWATELTLMFACGFILASVLWLSLWFFNARPSQAMAMTEKESAMAACQAEKDRYRGQVGSLQAESKQLDAKLRDARLGWGRCLRGKEEATAPATAQASPPLGKP